MSGTLLATANGFEVQGRLDLSASTSIASATTLDLTTLATGNIVPVTGTTPVEGITMPVGSMTIIPADALPLVYNATTCKIIGGANYTCTAGVPVELVNDGSVVHVFPIEIAATANIGVEAGNVQQVDQAITATTREATTTLGTTLNHTLSDTSATITAFNGVAGVRYRCRALGAGIIQHHATDLIITQTGADITTAAGDTFEVYMLTDTTCRIENYVRASGAPLIPTASQAEMESGTEAALRSMSPLLVGQAIAAQASPAAYKMTTETRNMTAASGSVSYTGAGFAPKKVTIYANVPGATVGSSQGEAVDTTSGIAQTSLRGWYDGVTVGLKLGSGVIDILPVGGTDSMRQYFTLTSFDSNGITGNWTKVGSPTGTATLKIVYER